MKTTSALGISFVLLTVILTLGVSTRAWADMTDYDIIIGHTIDVDNPTGLVYRDDGFWVMRHPAPGQTHAEWRLQNYNMSGGLVGEYEVPGSLCRFGLAWDGTYWWIADNNYGPETIYKCVLNTTENRLDPVKSYVWPYAGPAMLEWAQGHLWVSDHSTDIIYRVTVGDTTLSADPWCTTNPEPWGLAWDGANMWSLTGPSGGFDLVRGDREIYKHDADGNIIETWHYPPADDPALGQYGGWGSGIAFAGNQLYYCDFDKDQIIEATPIPAPGAVVLGVIGLGFANWRLRRSREL